jgi:C-terminal peptidase prc
LRKLIRTGKDSVKVTSKNSKTRSVIANGVKQSRVFVRNYERLPRRYAPRNDVAVIFKGPLNFVTLYLCFFVSLVIFPGCSRSLIQIYFIMNKSLALSLTLSTFLFTGCGIFNPPPAPSHDDEFEFCWYALSVLFIFQERLPADPHVYSTPTELYQSVNDPYTRYLTPQQAQSLLGALTTQSSDAGVRIDSAASGYIIREVYQNSPGEKAGLAAGDTIRAVGLTQLAQMTQEQAASLLAGAVGDSARLTLKRMGSFLTVTVVFSTYLAPSVHTDSLDSATAYIALTMFSETTPHALGSAGEFGDALDKTAWARYTVLDLRHNYGGSLYQCVSIVSQFVPESTVIMNTRERTADSLYPTGRTIEDRLLAETGQKAVNRRFFVLVDNYTASASEILVSCLKERRAQSVKIIGTRTFGKGSGWTYRTTPLSAMVTITKMLFTPVTNPVYNLIGITPDIATDSTGDALLTALAQIQAGGLAKKSAAVMACRRIEENRKQYVTKFWYPTCIVK